MSENTQKQSKYDQLSPAKRALMEKWTRQRAATPLVQAEIVQHPETEPAPLSYAQQYIWSLLQRYPDLSLFHFPLGEVVLHGPLQRNALEQGISDIVQRHAIFRMLFFAQQEKVFQQVSPQSMLPHITYVPVEQLSEEKKEEDIEQLLAQEMLRPFDISHGPHLRVLLIQRQKEEHILVCITHRMIADGWSRGVFYRELNAIYQAYVEGTQPQLPSIPFQYSDFATWQRRTLQQAEFQTQSNYWSQRLHGAPPLFLPAHTNRQSIQSSLADHFSFSLPETLSHALRQQSRQEGVTLFMLLFATFTLLLHSRTRQDDLVILTPTSNRNQAGTEYLIGSFVNNLVIRTDMSHLVSFADLLQRVRQAILDAYAHQFIPYEMIVENLHAPLQVNDLPFARCMFILHDVPLSQFNLAGLVGQRFYLTHEHLLQDIIITVITLQDDIQFYIRYKRELFQSDVIQALSEEWQELLSMVITCPEKLLL